MQLFESVSRWFAHNPMLRRMRHMPRVPVNEQAVVRVGPSDDVNLVLLRDISSGGACIRTDMRLAKSDTIWMRVGSGTPEQFDVTATVIAIRRQTAGFFTDYGLRLVEMNLDSARLLERFIERRAAVTRAR